MSEEEVIITDDIPDLRIKKGEKWTLVKIENGQATLKNETGRMIVPVRHIRSTKIQDSIERRKAMAAAAEEAEDSYQDVKSRIKKIPIRI